MSEFRKYINEGYKGNRKYSSKEAEKYFAVLSHWNDFQSDVTRFLMDIASANGNDVAMDSHIDFAAAVKKIKQADFYDKSED